METERLLIREYTSDDFAALHLILADPATMAFWPAPFTMEQVDDWIYNNLDRYEELGFGRWALILKETGDLIGDCGFMRSELDGVMENDLGYIIYEPFWHQGYAFEAAQACLRYGFDTLGLTRICANMPTNHAGSERVAQKLGMRKEKEYRNRRNRNFPTLLYAVEKPEESLAASPT